MAKLGWALQAQSRSDPPPDCEIWVPAFAGMTGPLRLGLYASGAATGGAAFRQMT
jgi:hypothetical protein